MATEIKIKQDIKKLEAAIKNKATPPKFLPKLKAQIAILEAQLSATQKTAKPTNISRAKELAAKYKKMYGHAFNGIDIERDADIPAKAIGRRVSQGLKGNQFTDKKNAKGHVYYEYRENRIDMKQPPKKYPKLEYGGDIEGAGSFANGGYMANGGKVDMAMLEMELKQIKKKYPNAKVGYTFAKDSNGKGYVITAKEGGKNVYSSYKMAKGGEIKKYAIVDENTDRIYIKNTDKEFIDKKYKELKEIYPNDKLSIVEFADGGYMEEGGTTGAGSFAKGGLVEHGLKVHDEIIRGEKITIGSDKYIIVKNWFFKEKAKVYLNTGKRVVMERYENGGTIGAGSFENGGALDAILGDTGGATTNGVGGTSFSSLDLTSNMDITNPMFEDGGTVGAGSFAKGGILEHGLKQGDKITLVAKNLMVVENDILNEKARINISTGKREVFSKMQDGGTIGAGSFAMGGVNSTSHRLNR